MIKPEIINLRAKIDQIDEKIAKLLSERVDFAVKIGALKDKLRSSEEDGKISAYDPIRENEIIERLKKIAPNVPLNGIEIIFRQIISLCRNSAHRTTVCVLGETKDFNYKEYFGSFCRYVNCSDFFSFVEEMNKNNFNIGVFIGDSKDTTPQEILKSNNFKLIDTFSVELKTIYLIMKNEER